MKRAGYYIVFISLFLAVTISLVFYFTLYKPHQDELMRIENKIQDLKTEIRSNEESILLVKKDIAELDLSPANLNYFNRNEVKGEEKIALFLKALNDLANKLGIRLLSITPGASKHNTGYIKDVFEIRLKSDFHRLIHLLFQLKNALGLNVDRLNIVAEDNNCVSELTTLILLNTLEMTDSMEQMARDLEELRALHIEREPNLRGIKPVQGNKAEARLASLDMVQDDIRDPFVKPEFIRKTQERLNQLERDLKTSRLLGIIDFDGQRHAIIGRHTVKRGDNIFNMEVLEIAADTVTLGNDKLRFTYQIKKDENIIPKKQGEL